jgi:hypothetical protein
MDTSWQLVAALATGFMLAQVAPALETLKQAVKYRQRKLDDDYVRMRAALVSLQFWLTEQSNRTDDITPRQFVVWRDYVTEVLRGPARPFVQAEQSKPAAVTGKAKGVSP